MPKTTFNTFKKQLIREIIEDGDVEVVIWTAPKNHIITINDVLVQVIEEVVDEDKQHYLCFLASSDDDNYLEEGAKINTKRNYELYKKV